MTLLQSFGRYVSGSQSGSLPPEIEHHARRALLDWHGALLAGSTVKGSDLLRQSYSDELGQGVCTVAGTLLKAPARAAAFLNGTISHIAEFDDIYREAVYHPGSPTISAALAVAESRGLGLQTLLRGIVAGYEVSNRIGQAVQPTHYEFFHTTGTAGVFGASAACASLLGLGAEASCHAMATAGTFASGLQQAFRSDSMTKPMHSGHAAEVGVHSALAAKAGMTGTPDLLEGKAGFGAALSRGARWDSALQGLGQDFLIARMTFKNHGCCGHAFAAIDGVAWLVNQHALRPEDIRSIRLGVYQASADVCAYRHPQTAFEAKFSLSYTVAARIVLGGVRERAFLASALATPAIADLEDRIQIHVDPACTATFPGQRSAMIEIELTSGERLVHHQTTRHGDPDDALTDTELMDKFMELSSPRIGEGQARRLAEQIMGEGDRPVSDLSRCWTQA